AAVGQMAAGMAHELRNPLTAMKVLVQATAARGPGAALRGRDLAVLEEEITRLERLTQTFLDLARPPEPDKRATDAPGPAAAPPRLLARRAEQQGVRLACDLPGRPLVLRADAGQLRQVLVNLLLNALDALPGGGTVRLRLAAAGSGVLLTVADTGCGLPPALG